MEMLLAVQVIGFIIALAFIVFGIDDLLWDIYALFRKVRGVHVDLTTLDQKPPKMLAIVIAAWHEDAVIGAVVDNLIRSAAYPPDLYRVFLAVYPNDPATGAVVDELAANNVNVVKVVNAHEGPTNKADNLNYAMRQIIAYEKEHGLRFAGITIHDSEDVVHPLELKMTNYLIDDYDALQFPVFPLMRMPRFGNFFKTLTTGTYADEFAEHHFRTLVMRDRLGFVPSAGTGFCLRRSFLDVYGDGKGTIMPDDSLTEDYKLSLSMNMAGYRVHYVLERVPRIDQHGRKFWDYIATRSLFPQKIKLAIKQKTRWVYGITMQSASMKDLFAKSSLSFRERTFLYKDLKAKFANFILLPGYLVFLYFLVSLFVPSLPIMYPYLSAGWWLCVFLTFMMVERQFLRGKAIVNVYGKRMMFFACLLPPLFPIRLIWGNIINICATTRAWAQKAAFDRLERRARRTGRVAGNGTKADEEQGAVFDGSVHPKNSDMKGLCVEATEREISVEEEPKPTWAKTDHEFLPEEVLSRYRRRYGDYLLLRGSLDEKSLSDVVQDTAHPDKLLGTRLLEGGFVSERDLASATALQNNTVTVELTPLLKRRMSCWDMPGLWEDAGAWPLLETAVGYLAVMPDTGGSRTVLEFERMRGKPVFMLVAQSSELTNALLTLGSEPVVTSACLTECTEGNREDFDVDFDHLRALCDDGVISLSQAGIALGYAINQERGIASVLRSMGLLRLRATG